MVTITTSVKQTIYIAFLIGIIVGIVKFSTLLSINIENRAIIDEYLRNKTVRGTNGSPGIQGLLAFQEKQYSKAINFLSNSNLEWNFNTRVVLARSYLELNDWQSAASVLHLDNAYERQLLIRILINGLDQISPQEDIHWQKQLSQRSPDLVIAYASHLLQEGNYERAKSWVYAIPNLEESSEGLWLLGQSLYRLGEYDEAAQALESAYTLSPDAERANLYGRSLLAQGDNQAALLLITEAVNNAPNEIQRAWFLRDLGITQAMVGNCADAEESLEKALQLLPEIKQRVESARVTVQQLCPVN